MNYFEILDLGAEPFSNSPDPDFLYRSKGHEQCLHGLEIALRLRRGLSVVLGEVGTGKTTLCRELLRELEGDETISAHLVLDPGFSTPAELLTVLHGLFHGGDAQGLSQWQLKEDIKHAIFRHAADGDKVLALIVDEGQKLPLDCLEVLRELLNYETNDRKLLQIVIFAQTEFRQSLEAMPNLADRVNDIIVLKPLGLAETKAMVRHRLDRAKSDYSAPELFTGPGYLALHRITGGYPRRVVRLAHKVVLALIMKESRKAGWRLVRSCARDNEIAPRRRAWVPALAVALLLVLGAWTGHKQYPPLARALAPLADMAAPVTELFATLAPSASASSEAAPAQDAPPAAMQAAAVPAPVPPVTPEREQVPGGMKISASEQATAPEPQALAAGKADAIEPPASEDAGPARALPDLLGTVAVRKGESIALLARAVYGELNKDLLETVLDANSGFGDPKLLQAGDVIRLPVADLKERQVWWIPLEQAKTLAEAIDHWRAVRRKLDVRILAHRQTAEGLRFTLIAGWPRGTREAALSEALVAGVQAEPVHGTALLMAGI